MEYYWTLLNNSNASSTVAGHNRNFNPSHAWDSSDLPTAAAAASRPDWTYYTPSAAPPMQHNHNNSTYSNPDSHLTCLKLGKRHYFEDISPPPPPPLFGPFTAAKKGKSCPAGPESGAPRCQVEGCEAVLLNAKDYHRRHKVCEMHAKAAKVVVLGMEQRFCQQCSRFHAVAEFDESKRSCRRRLLGHNQRRRKTSQQLNNVATKHHYHGGQLVNNGECALSLLSPTNYTPWSAASSSTDLPARCSAALRELIAENRASVMASPQLFNPDQNRGHVTLNLMQGPEPAFGIMSGHKDDDGDCSELWNLPLGY